MFFSRFPGQNNFFIEIDKEAKKEGLFGVCITLLALKVSLQH